MVAFLAGVDAGRHPVLDQTLVELAVGRVPRDDDLDRRLEEGQDFLVEEGVVLRPVVDPFFDRLDRRSVGGSVEDDAEKRVLGEAN
jgi:hypothetical protein